MSACLMIQGTSSDAGKSLVVTALCRWLKRRGLRVAPFKPQNMALNSAVTADGGEIGRAQAVQALACGLEPSVEMNPILLKPNTDVGSQVIVHGQALGNFDARAYHEMKPRVLEAAVSSFNRLMAAHDVVIVEGAGSPAEINLREGDIANMGFAEAVDCPVVLVGDIDRGGVFAQFVGTMALISESERARVRGFIVNKFRGDVSLLQPGLDWLEAHAGKPVLGVMPFHKGLYLASEDSYFDIHAGAAAGPGALKVLVPRLPRISNHTDLDPLRLHPGVALTWWEPGQPIPGADLIILPGSKSVRHDLDWLRRNGWEAAIARHLRYGGQVIGVCGGFQMLGEILDDADGVEGTPGVDAGLGLLKMTTRFGGDKTLINCVGRLADVGGQAPGASGREPQAAAGTGSHGEGLGPEVAGYEIHMGQSEGPALARPMLFLETFSGRAAPALHADGSAGSGPRPHGAVSDDGQVMGCYLHGLFDRPEACQALLTWAGYAPVGENSGVPGALDMAAAQEAEFDRLADSVERDLDTAALLEILGLG